MMDIPRWNVTFVERRRETTDRGISHLSFSFCHWNETCALLGVEDIRMQREIRRRRRYRNKTDQPMIFFTFTSLSYVHEQFAASMHTCLIINVLHADVLLLLYIRTLAIRRKKWKRKWEKSSLTSVRVQNADCSNESEKEILYGGMGKLEKIRDAIKRREEKEEKKKKKRVAA